MMRLETEQMAAIADARQGGQGGHVQIWPPECIWVAYYDDHSDVVPCATEIDALRIAVDRGMKVVRVPIGVSVWEAVEAKRQEVIRR